MTANGNPLFDPLMLGKRAQRIRTEKHLSIEALARQAGVNKNTVVRFEKGISTRMDTLYKICHVLGVSPLQLVEGKLIKGRDYAIQCHETDAEGRQVRHVSRQDRVHSDQIHGMVVGDLNYRLPGGRMGGKVLEIVDQEPGDKKTHPGEELLFCLTGTIGIELSNVKAILQKGDAIFFWGSEPHCYFNADETREVSVALSVVNGNAVA